MPSTLAIALAALAAYLIGSLSFAVIVSRLMGLSDPRSYGSGNPGATNVLRSGNKTAAILTLVFDALKGFVPVLLVVLFGRRFGLGEGTAAIVAVAAFLGHLLPVALGIKCGPSRALASRGRCAPIPCGCLPWPGRWLIPAACSRPSSLASRVGAGGARLSRLMFWG